MKNLNSIGDPLLGAWSGLGQVQLKYPRIPRWEWMDVSWTKERAMDGQYADYRVVKNSRDEFVLVLWPIYNLYFPMDHAAAIAFIEMIKIRNDISIEDAVETANRPDCMTAIDSTYFGLNERAKNNLCSAGLNAAQINRVEKYAQSLKNAYHKGLLCRIPNCLLKLIKPGKS